MNIVTDEVAAAAAARARADQRAAQARTDLAAARADGRRAYDDLVASLVVAHAHGTSLRDLAPPWGH
jgi:hypothetical protein